MNLIHQGRKRKPRRNHTLENVNVEKRKKGKVKNQKLRVVELNLLQLSPLNYNQVLKEELEWQNRLVLKTSQHQKIVINYQVLDLEDEGELNFYQ